MPGPAVGRSNASEHAPGLARRLAAMAYDFLLASAVLFLAGLPVAVIADGNLAGMGRLVYQGYLFFVLGLYFNYCWHRGGQTLGMKTWKLRVVRFDGAQVSRRRAALRYLLAWPSIGFAGAGIVWTLFDRDGQYLHDRLAGTRISRSDAM